MSSSTSEKSPFTRPSFIAAAMVIALIVVSGVMIGVLNATRKTPSPAAPDAQSAIPSTPQVEPSEAHGETSVCGLAGKVLEGRLPTGPTAEWQYQGTTAYPTSSEFGPGATDPAGFRYCFQHSPEGALFAAANALATATDQSLMPTWIEYFASKGANRDDLLSEGNVSKSTSNNEGTRLKLTGFRLLAYNGNTARVDLAVHGSTPNGTVTLSMVYELVWQDGDWKLNTDSENPVNVASIPNISGYVAFGE